MLLPWVSSLSGSNQQKTILARWLAAKPRLLILDEPTHGVDVGAKAEIYNLIRKLADEGMSICLISSELPEVLAMADRVVVMHDGEVEAILARSEGLSEGRKNHALRCRRGSLTRHPHVDERVTRLTGWTICLLDMGWPAFLAAMRSNRSSALFAPRSFFGIATVDSLALT